MMIHSQSLSKRKGKRPKQKPTKPIEDPNKNTEEWKTAKTQAVNRNVSHSADCSICLEPLFDLQNPSISVNSVSLLLCSHVFHSSCINSFERVSGTSSCPLCRQHYTEKLNHFDPSLHYKTICAIKLQALFRGSLSRWAYRRTLKQTSKLPPNQAREFIYQELSSISDKYFTDIYSHRSQVDSLLEDIDRSISLQRTVLRNAMKQMNNVHHEVDWSLIYSELASRHQLSHSNSTFNDTCPICLNDLSVTFKLDRRSGKWKLFSKNKICALTDCKHLLHDTCLSSFEKLGCSFINCPVCRSVYNKIKLPLE
ncbi:hypothetical protein GEMRC1_005967 [Eukaryota sp. GEM-RC1]